MQFSGISSPALKKKSPPTSRGSGESTQRFYPNESQAQAFSIQYPHLDTTSWICLAVGIADTQGGPRIKEKTQHFKDSARGSSRGSWGCSEGRFHHMT